MVRPEMVMAFALPMFLVAKFPAMEAVERITESPLSRPDNAALEVSSVEVALAEAL